MDKQHILDEIKRTAEMNGGVLLGRSRFFQATGIRPSDWEGKFWARWGDAVREAGYVPNQLQEAYDEEMLLEKFIALMRELGRLPVHAELLLKSRNDPAFPSHGTSARFGTKQQLSDRVQEYCTSRSGFDDVLALCGTVMSRPRTRSGDVQAFKRRRFM